MHAAATRRRRDCSHQWTDSERPSTSRSIYSIFSFLLFLFDFFFWTLIWWVIYRYSPASSKGRYRLFTVPYFPVRSSRCVTGGNLGWVPNQLERRPEKYVPPPIAITQTAAPSVHINPRWPPVLVSAQSWRSYEKIRDCGESRDVNSTVFGVGGRKSPIWSRRGDVGNFWTKSVKETNQRVWLRLSSFDPW